MTDPLWMYKLKNGLLGTPDEYGGLLGADAAKRSQGEGFMTLGANLLAAGGPSRTPTSLGQALGPAILQGRQAQQQMQSDALQALILKQKMAESARLSKGDLVPVMLDGKIVYKNASDASGLEVGFNPYANEAKPATDIQYYTLYAQQENAAGRKPKSFQEWSKDYYSGKQAGGGTVTDYAGGRAYVETRGEDRGQVTPLTTAEQEAAGRATVAGAEAGAKVTATTQAEKAAALPATLATIDKLGSNIQALLLDPGFDTIYGKTGALLTKESGDLPWFMAGTSSANAAAKRKQIDAQTFGEAIQTMKGLGQLSNAEGLKVTAAYTRATNPNIDPDEARSAWREVLTTLNKSRERAKKSATGDNSPDKAPAAALEYLKANPGAKDQFKAKYGYLPDGY